ncbi:MAG: hypothetical protein NVSMB59_00940 [Vulcanimicrobiaceae bacterium]
MKRLARLAFVIGSIATSLVLGVDRSAVLATPFSDVPANHWAYQYLQSLAADGIIDGYPSGKFKGDRPLTRYEMATVVARTIAKLQENTGKTPSKEDLDKLQKLIDALKDELDSLGVRVTNLEDSVDALDKRTKFAQSLSLHGVFLPNVSLRQRTGIPRSIVNTSGAAQPLYYGGTVQPNTVAGADPFVTAIISSDDSNNAITNSGSGIRIRQDSRFSLAYAITDNLTLSLPVHVLNFTEGGEFTQQQKVDLEPGVDVNIAKSGNIANLHVKFGIIDDMSASRIGLAFRPPQGYNGAVPYELPIQPFQKGAEVSGSVGEGAFGITDFQLSFSRLDQTLIDTQTGATDPSVLPGGATSYLYPVVPPSGGLTQTTGPGATNLPIKEDTFSAGTGTLGQVFLTSKALAGSVYVSYYNGTTYNAAGTPTGGPGAPLPGFTYNDAYNDVVFAAPLPAGAVIRLSYRPLAYSTNTNFQRYMIHARLNQKIKGYKGLEVGLNFNRIFDYDDLQTTGSGLDGTTAIFANPVTGNGAVSDTVLGLDFQLPLPFEIAGAGSNPILFGELAHSKYTSDFRNVAAVGDTAGVFGLRLKVHQVELSAQYQSVGSDFFDGAPFRYFGNPPPLFAFYKLSYLPDFFGLGNNVGINGQFDSQFANVGLAGPRTVGNPNLTFAFPLYNTLKASGPEFFSSFAPNSRGFTTAVNSPIRIGDFNLTARASYQHLEEIRPNSLGSLLYGPSFATNVRQNFDTYGVGTSFKLPVFGQTATVNFNGSYETLKRLDTRGFAYYPVNPATQTFDGNAFAAAQAPAVGGSKVTFYPNYINVHHYTYAANVAMPLTKDIVGSVSYNTQLWGGAYGTTLNQNISEHKDYLTGAVTYNIPKTNSSLSVGARRYRYNDDVVPNVNFVQNRQDLNFTVRF